LSDAPPDAGGQCALRLGRNHLVRLTVVLAALRVTDDGVAATEFLQHGHAHFAGVGALLVRRHVLRTPGNGTALQK